MQYVHVYRVELPIVLDIGLDDKSENKFNYLRLKSPQDWTDCDRKLIRGNTFNSNSGVRIPRKLVHGSDYFYGQSNAQNPLTFEGQHPPFSYALSGLSIAWVPRLFRLKKALESWPIPSEELYQACASILTQVPYSFQKDSLSSHFRP